MALSRLLGSETEGTTAIVLSKGLGNAFLFTASDTGRIDSFVYKTGSGASGTATSVRVAVMTKVSGKPGTIVGSEAPAANGADTTGSKSETKYEATGLGANVVKGTEYFLVILPIGGTVRMKGGNGEAEAGQRSSGGEVATIAAAGSWNEPKTFGNPVYVAGLGPITIEQATLGGGGSPKVAVTTVRVVPSAVLGGGGSPVAVTPVPKGVKAAVLGGGGSPRVVSQSKRNVTAAVLGGGGSPVAKTPVYGNAEVYGYGEPSIWRVVQPYKAASPGSPIIIYLHESSHDEPTEAEAPNVLPRPGETLTAIRPIGEGGNGRQLNCTPFAEDANTNGFACFVPAYRPLAEGSPGVPAYQFSQADVEALIAWVKQHAEAWNGDPNKVCIIGGSFGVTIGMHEALKLNHEKGARYIVACAGLSGPIDIPSRVKGRDEEVAAKEAWEAAHPGFTKAELEAWEAEHNYANTDVVSKLAHYIGVAAARLEELGWLEGPSAEQKAALKLSEELSPFYDLATLSSTMPYLWYAISHADVTPQQQGEEMSEAAAAHGQPGKYHFNPTVSVGHAYGFYSSVKTEIYAYFRQAINPPTVGVATLAGGGRPVAKVTSNRVATLGGGGSPHVSVTTKRIVVKAVLGGGGRPVVRVKPKEPQPPNTPTRATVISYRTRATIFSNSTRAKVKTGSTRATIQDRRTRATLHGG